MDAKFRDFLRLVIYQIYHMIGHIRKLSGKPGKEAET